MPPFLKTTQEMKISPLVGGTGDPAQSAPPTCAASCCGRLLPHLSSSLPLTLQLLPFLSPRASPWHWTCSPADLLTIGLHLQEDLPPAGSWISSRHFRFRASPPTSAVPTLPCPARHEMTRFANTLPSSGPLPWVPYVFCFLSRCLCFPRDRSSLSSSSKSLKSFFPGRWSFSHLPRVSSPFSALTL